MIRNIAIFGAMFLAGALIALVARTALFSPHAGHEATTPGAEYEPMVSNPLTPAAPAAPSSPPVAAPAPESKDPHAGHTATTAEASPPTAASQPVNTICAICGMDVDPTLPTAEYQGKTIGFGCRMCPPKLRADPDKYGPSYLRNELYKP